MKKIILVLLISIFGTSVYAQEKKKNKNSKIKFRVEGICEMCEKRIEAAAFTVKGVKSADWNSELNEINLILDENKCSKKDVATAIAAIGHDTEFAIASDKAYNELHGCCKYERK